MIDLRNAPDAGMTNFARACAAYLEKNEIDEAHPDPEVLTWSGCYH
jgi:hypothetical protein